MRPGARTTGLLVSVCSRDDALAAMAGGATLIDIKDPQRGSLGRASNQVIDDVIKAVGHRLPVSAACGEWNEHLPVPSQQELGFVKWGLSRLHEPWSRQIVHLRGAAARPVLVAYADWERAQSPPPELLAEWAYRLHFPGFLIDTAVKDGSRLLDWLPYDALARIVGRLLWTKVRIALAGNLGQEDIARLLPLNPDWFAVRTAACSSGRHSSICAHKVSQLKALIQPVRAAG